MKGFFLVFFLWAPNVSALTLLSLVPPVSLASTFFLRVFLPRISPGGGGGLPSQGAVTPAAAVSLISRLHSLCIFCPPQPSAQQGWGKRSWRKQFSPPPAQILSVFPRLKDIWFDMFCIRVENLCFLMSSMCFLLTLVKTQIKIRPWLKCPRQCLASLQKPSKPCVLGIKSQFLNVHLVSISSVSKALAAKMLFATYDVTSTTHLLPAREETKPGAGNGCKYCWWWKCLKSHQAGHYHADGRRRWIFQGWGITTVLQSRRPSGNNLLSLLWNSARIFMKTIPLSKVTRC